MQTVSSKRLVSVQKNRRLSGGYGWVFLQFFRDHLGCVEYKAIVFHFYVNSIAFFDGKPISNFLGKIESSSNIQ